MPELELPPARYETSDIKPRVVALLGGIAFAMLLLAVGLILVLFPHSLKDRALSEPFPEFASPRLETDPRADFAALRARQAKELASYGWVDRDHGVVHEPIERAMAKLAQDGIPGWPAAGGKP